MNALSEHPAREPTVHWVETDVQPDVCTRREVRSVANRMLKCAFLIARLTGESFWVFMISVQ